MGKKRQRSAVNGTEEKSALSAVKEQGPSTPSGEPQMTSKKHKKAPLQLKMIVMKGAVTSTKKTGPIAIVAPSKDVSTTTTTADVDLSTKRKKKNKNKKSKSSASTSTNATDNAGANGDSKTAKKAATSEDIDDLFNSLKTKKQESLQAIEREKMDAAESWKKEKKARDQLEEQIKKLEAQNTNSTAVQGKNPDPRPVRYDPDGLPIYKEDALQINQGGDTAECPFDCWCCF